MSDARLRVMLPTPRPPASAVPAARLRETIDGPEKYCPRCDEWWPADKEFFWETKGKLFYCCKACYHEMDRRPGRRGVP